MSFDWLRILDQYKVPYATAGKNVSRGNFVVHCPFCGHEDQGMHMSVALKGRGWRCLRRNDQRGNHPGRLLAPLLGISIEQAYRLVGDAVFVPDDFLAAVNAALADEPANAGAKPLKMPAEFRAIDLSRPSQKLAVNYLRERGFLRRQIESISEWWDIRIATAGAYRHRIIFPVYRDGALVGWTGRHIGNHEIRYKTLSPDPEKAEAEGYKPALGPISDYLLFHDQLLDYEAHTLYLVEGPFDALKVNVLGSKRGAIATCCFTAQPSESQVAELHMMFPRFKRKVLLLDRGTIANALRTSRQFAGMGLMIGELPQGVKDPGDLTQDQFDEIQREVCHG